MPSGLFMGLISTLIYTSELILCSTICVHSATNSGLTYGVDEETLPFLTVKRMCNTSYRELWTNVSLDRWAVNFMQMRYAYSLLLNCCLSLIKISCFKGLN